MHYPLRLSPERPISYFDVPESFSFKGLFANPMYLMFGVAILMTMFMPKMQMDPEQMKQMQDMQKQMKSNWLMNMFQWGKRNFILLESFFPYFKLMVWVLLATLLCLVNG